MWVYLGRYTTALVKSSGVTSFLVSLERPLDHTLRVRSFVLNNPKHKQNSKQHKDKKPPVRGRNVNVLSLSRKTEQLDQQA